MRIGISALNVQTEEEYWRLNNLISKFGESRPGWTFLLIAGKEQEGFLISAPDNFEYRFTALPLSTFQSDSPPKDDFVHASISEFDCDLIFEYGSSGLNVLDCPKVSLTTSESTVKARAKKGKSGPGFKLRLVAGSASGGTDRTENVIFPSRIAADRSSGNAGKAEIAKVASDNRRILAGYGVSGRFIFSVVPGDGLGELENLLRAYGHALSLNSDIPPLVIAGGGQEPAKIAPLISAADRSGLDSKINFLGNVPDYDMPAFLEESAAVIYTRENDYGRGSLMTAIACGCAIIASNSDNIPEISGEAVLYFDPENWSDLGFKLALISEDSDLVEFLKNRSKDMAPRFSWENTADRMIEFFADILADRKAAAITDTAKVSTKR